MIYKHPKSIVCLKWLSDMDVMSNLQHTKKFHLNLASQFCVIDSKMKHNCMLYLVTSYFAFGTLDSVQFSIGLDTKKSCNGDFLEIFNEFFLNVRCLRHGLSL